MKTLLILPRQAANTQSGIALARLAKRKNGTQPHDFGLASRNAVTQPLKPVPVCSVYQMTVVITVLSGDKEMVMSFLKISVSKN